MSTARRQRRKSQKYFEYLGALLMGFYEFLEQEKKPCDAEVRQAFKNANAKWKFYCKQNGLQPTASDLFTKEVAESWRKRYTEQPPIQLDGMSEQ